MNPPPRIATVITRDKDMAQLIREGDVYWDFGARGPYSYQDIERRFGVAPERFADYLALAGDSVDNIPGIPGVGPKTAAALLALGATLRTDRRELPIADLYRLPTEDDRDVVALEPGELILELEVSQPEASTYLKAMDRNRFTFALVGVAAARSGEETRLALSAVAPIPWLLGSPDDLDRATPLPGTAYKVEIARALVERARTAVA